MFLLTYLLSVTFHNAGTTVTCKKSTTLIVVAVIIAICG